MHFVQFKEEKGIFFSGFSGEQFSLSQRFRLADGLRSHVIITSCDKSRYNLIVEINEKV